jgi:AbrB family looped-hinge helix DNA binding protein
MKVSSKGQITIPKKIRDRLGLHAGVEVLFRETEYGFILKRKTEGAFPEDDIRADAPLTDETEKALELTRGKL